MLSILLSLALLFTAALGTALTFAEEAGGDSTDTLYPNAGDPGDAESTDAPEETTEEITTEEPTTEEPTTKPTEPETTVPADYRISIHQDDIYASRELIRVYYTDDKSKRLLSEATVGRKITIEVLELDDDLKSVRKILFLKNGESVENTIYVEKQKYYYFNMENYDLVLEVEVGDDPDKVASSVQESRSLEESASVEEALIESSIEAEKHFKYGDYVIECDVSEVVPPARFIRANDVSNFERTVGCFYSTQFRIFVYYASRDGKYGYFVRDNLTENLIPYVTFAGNGNKNFVVTSAESVKSIPGIYRETVKIALEFAKADREIVPGYLTIDGEGNSVKLIHLNSSLGDRGFYVYDDSSGVVELTEWEKYSDKLNGDASSFTVEPSKEAVSKDGLSRTSIWVIIISVIAVLLVAAVVTVSIMSKRQQQAEDDLDDEPLSGPDDDSIDDDALQEDEPVEDFELSPYRNSGKETAEEEEKIDFAFPEGAEDKAVVETTDPETPEVPPAPEKPVIPDFLLDPPKKNNP